MNAKKKESGFIKFLKTIIKPQNSTKDKNKPYVPHWMYRNE